MTRGLKQTKVVCWLWSVLYSDSLHYSVILYNTVVIRQAMAILHLFPVCTLQMERGPTKYFLIVYNHSLCVLLMSDKHSTIKLNNLTVNCIYVLRP